MRSRHAAVAVALALLLSVPAPGQRSAGPLAGAAAAVRAVPGDTTTLCVLRIDQATGSTVDVYFSGMPGNQPATSQNFVALWQNSVIPWTVAPLQKTTVLQNAESGTLVLLGVSITTVAYTVGYAVGPRVADVCASAGLQPDGTRGPTDAVSMSITALGSNSISIHYHTLAGYLPATSGNWIGLWRGRASPYNPPPPVARIQIPGDVTDDDVRIDGVVLRVGSPYTLIYFMGPEMTSAAVIIGFMTPGR
ncbi:MAG: hypothetical protein ACJ8J0_12880 [Longimicrobiaceae bacterium]